MSNEINGYYIPRVVVQYILDEVTDISYKLDMASNSLPIEIGDTDWNIGVQLVKEGKKWCDVSKFDIACPISNKTYNGNSYAEIDCHHCLAAEENADVLLKIDLKFKMDKYLNEDEDDETD
jgi:hypothetical protein